MAEIFESMGLTTWGVIWTIVNFSILVLVLWKFGYPFILKAMDKRKKEINDALEAADKARAEVAATEETLRVEIARARAEAEQIVISAKAAGETVKNEIIEQARAEALAISKSAQAMIEQDKKEALKELKKEIADMIILATEKVLASGLTEQQQKVLMDKYIKEVGQLQ